MALVFSVSFGIIATQEAKADPVQAYYWKTVKVKTVETGWKYAKGQPTKGFWFDKNGGYFSYNSSGGSKNPVTISLGYHGLSISVPIGSTKKDDSVGTLWPVPKSKDGKKHRYKLKVNKTYKVTIEGRFSMTGADQGYRRVKSKTLYDVNFKSVRMK